MANKKHYDLEERTMKFAKMVNRYVNELPKTIPNLENGKQLVRSSGSVGANYIEANESVSDKDCILRMKICRKEAKESAFWLNLTEPNGERAGEKLLLIKEAQELTKIFGSIIEKLNRK